MMRLPAPCCVSGPKACRGTDHSRCSWQLTNSSSSKSVTQCYKQSVTLLAQQMQNMVCHLHSQHFRMTFHSRPEKEMINQPQDVPCFSTTVPAATWPLSSTVNQQTFKYRNPMCEHACVTRKQATTVFAHLQWLMCEGVALNLEVGVQP